MNASPTQTRAGSYVSGVALGVAVMVLMLAPHLKIAGGIGSSAPAACAGRMTADQVASLRGVVLSAEARRQAILGGGSLYAAAKIGGGPVSPAAVEAADRAVGEARARFAAACD